MARSRHATQQFSPHLFQPLSPGEQLAQLTGEADLIVRGRVRAQSSHWDETRTSIVTDSTIAVRYGVARAASLPIAGTAPDAPTTLTVRTLGGELPAENIALGVSHEAHLDPGQEVLLFLRAGASPTDAYTVVGGERGAQAIDNGHLDVATSAGNLAITETIDIVEQAARRRSMIALLPPDWQAQEALPPSPHLPQRIDDFVYGEVKWPGDAPVIDYLVNVNSGQTDGGNGSRADFLAAIDDAAATWNSVATADFTFVNVGETDATWSGSPNGRNEIVFRAAGQSGTLGQTRYWYNPTTATMVEADVWFNDSYIWDATGAPTGNEIDLQSVALHEFGHWFVLGHDDNPAAIMYFAIGAGALKRTLYSSDIEGISFIYPCENQPCGTSVDPPTPVEEPTEIPPEVPTEIPTEIPTEVPPELPTEEPTAIPLPPFTPTPEATTIITPTVVPTATAGPPPIATVEDPLPTPPAATSTPAPELTPGFTPTVVPDVTPDATPGAAPESVDIAPDRAATVNFGQADSGPALVLDVPGGAVDQPTTLDYTPLTEQPAAEIMRDGYAGARFVLAATQAGRPADSLTFLAPVGFQVAYPQPAEPLDEASVRLYYFDSVTAAWQPAACGPERVDVANNIAVVDVCRTGEFALFTTVTIDPEAMDAAIFLPVIRR